MPKSISVKPRFWLFLIVLFLVVFTPLYIILDGHSQKLAESRAQLAETRAALEARVAELNNDLAYLRSEQGIEQFARAEGMIMKGETQYVADTDAN